MEGSSKRIFIFIFIFGEGSRSRVKKASLLAVGLIRDARLLLFLTRPQLSPAQPNPRMLLFGLRHLLDADLIPRLGEKEEAACVANQTNSQ